MNVLLVAVNSKYTHTSLSVRTLSRNAYDVPFAEFTINEKIDYIISEVCKKAPDVVCFSCYIWNIEIIKKVASSVKKIIPVSKIVFGGPEVSYTPTEILSECGFVDAVICGEGEITFRKLVESNFCFEGTDGVVYRHGNNITVNSPAKLIENLDELIFPYTEEDLKENSGKLIYYESSRGCPYNCSYCISSTIHSLRFKSIDKVKEELMILIKHKPKTIKFVDRTFNADNKRTCELIRFMTEQGVGVVFHFEIAAHTLSDEFIELIKNAPEGMFRLEIGLQSTNPETIKAINRVTDFEKLSLNVKKLVECKKAHIHLDLIAGLPYEDMESFKNSFNDAMRLKPDVLQLGFLKMLKGTEIRGDKEKYSYSFSDYPPYEVISNNFMSYSDISFLKKIDETVDKIYNSGAFSNMLSFLETKFGSYFEMYSYISEVLEKSNFFDISLSRNSVYEILAGVLSSVDKRALDLLKYDYFLNTKNASTPLWSAQKYDVQIHKKRLQIIEFYRDSLFLKFSGMNIHEILKKVHFERFSYDVLGNRREKDIIIVFENNGSVLGEIKPELL